MKLKLWIFGALLIAALIGFGDLVNGIKPLGIVEFDKSYAERDLLLHVDSERTPEFDPSLARQKGGVNDLLLLADAYLIGHKVEVSPTNAVDCFSKVLEKDAHNPRALMGMAICYYMGSGVERNLDNAADLGCRAVVAVTEGKDESYSAVRLNPFTLLCLLGSKRRSWGNENTKERSLPKSHVFPTLLYFCIAACVLFGLCFVKPNILDAPWQLKVEKVLNSFYVAFVLMLALEFAYYCDGASLALAVMLFVFFLRMKCILPFCVLGAWWLHLRDLSTVPFLDFEPAWNNIPLLDHAVYGNVAMSSGAYMSIGFPNVCPGFNGAYLYGALFTCTVLMYGLRISAALRSK